MPSRVLNFNVLNLNFKLNAPRLKRPGSELDALWNADAMPPRIGFSVNPTSGEVEFDTAGGEVAHLSAGIIIIINFYVTLESD